ncbi:MAG: T9SS type A sorting domain-containing protein [Flavobacteriaceae bacterium]
MKKIIHLIGILTVILSSNMGNAQIELTPLSVCDNNNDGFSVFDLSPSYAEIYINSGTNIDSHTIYFFETEQDAEFNQSSIPDYLNYFNTLPFQQTLYGRLENNANSNDYIIYSVDLIVNEIPEFTSPIDLFATEFSAFDLTVNASGNPDYDITFHESEADASAGANAILSITSYSPITYSQTIYMRVENQLGCFIIKVFKIHWTNGDLPIPSTVTHKICDDNSDGLVIHDLDNTIPVVLGDLSLNEHVISFHSSEQGALNNTDLISDTENYIAGVIGDQVFCRIQNTISNELGYTTLSFDVKKKPIIYPIPDLVVYQGDNYTGIATFDLMEDVAMGGYITIPNENGEGLTVNFHLTEDDAITGTNPLNVNDDIYNYENTSNPQTLYVSAQNTSIGAQDCERAVKSFVIRVEAGDEEIIYIPDANFKSKLLQANASNNIAKNAINQKIKIDTNNDGEIQVSEALAVYQLNISQSNIEDLTGIEAFINLIYLSCPINDLTELDLSNNINLTSLDCSNNNLTELDLSNNTNLEILWAIFNTELSYLNIKNGENLNPSAVDEGSWMEMWMNLPNNIYICADESEIDLIHPYLNIFGAAGQIVSSYCSFYPVGNYNTITGAVAYDFNDDGCDETDVIHYTKIIINDGTDGGASFTNQNGEYTFFTQDGTFTLTPEIENPSYFNVTPVTETVVFTDNDNNEEIVNFCITPNGVHNDLEVVVAPITPAVPGFEATYKIVYRNKGNQVMSQDYGLNFFYNQQLTSFVSASVAPDTQGQGGLNWNYEDLMPFESREILVTMQINPPTDPVNPVNIDDELIFTSVISPQTDDENVLDNTFIFNQTVIGSYDPNDITCIEGDIIEPEYIGEELHYLIRFENTGNYYAENVVVAMEIDEEKYDMTSVRLLNTSHNANAQIKDNVLEVFFNQIMLDSGGHGNILLVMKSINTLSEGDSVQSKADIYFDYNYPIITNDAVTIFQATASIEDNIQNIDLKFYPNPTTDYFNITSEALIQSVELYDVSGRLVRTSLVNDFESKQNINNLNNGVYILKIKTQQGEITGKIIKK